MKHIPFLIIFILIVSCSEKSTTPTTTKTTLSTPKKENIVLIFGKRSFKKDTIYFNNGKSYSLKRNPILSYIHLYPYERKQLISNNIAKNDTIIIPTKNQILLEHNYHYFYNSTYLLKAGDTIQFEYKDDAPYATILNNKKLKDELNFEVSYNMANKIYMNNIQFREKNKRSRTKEESSDYYNTLLPNRIKELATLDSINKKGNLDPDYYNLLNTKLKYTINLLTNFSEIKKEKIELQNDSLLSISIYKHFLPNYIWQKLEIPTIKKRNIPMYDYLVAFDSVQKSDLLSKKIKNYLLFHSLTEIATYYSLDDFKLYHKKFTATVKDTTLLNIINNKYLTNFISLKENTDKIYLINRKKEKTTLQEVIDQHKGKVVYVDFWASWCAPCRVAIKPAKKLIQQYKNKDFVYVYISIDTDFSKWQTAAKEENLTYFRNSYLGVNYPSAAFYKQMQLKTIPRYIMYDKQGDMISKDAPSPKDEEIHELINQYIDN
ncbi:TlpA family protein disulfide reductase [Kordia sp.]|uniref:TlpA family protein disulfide reductase n=1 Tax=Kordia sp. TaxID=1965332 RepID=UPI003B5CF840